jgi:hypothetical protein
LRSYLNPLKAPRKSKRRSAIESRFNLVAPDPEGNPLQINGVEIRMRSGTQKILARYEHA